jgi:hypothetical protein
MEEIIANGLTGVVRWCGLGRGAYVADPYGIQLPDGDRLIMAERYDYRAPGDLKARGEIVAARLGRGAGPETLRFAPAISSVYHMSYPSLIEDGGRWYLFVESGEAHGLSCYSAVAPTGPWEFHRLIIPGVPVIDPTLVAHQGRWYLFCTRLDDGPLSRLWIFTANGLFGPWTPHPGNPVRDDRRTARPAGPIFRARDGVLYRPAQDCSLTYGGAVVIHRIDELTPQRFRETELRRIAPVPGRWGAGLHQICALGDETLIDGKAYEWSMTEPFDRTERERRHASRAAEGAKRAGGQLPRVSSQIGKN